MVQCPTIIIKKANGQSIYFNYDEQGKLIGEYDGSNNPIREYIYLGNQPIALFSSEKENEASVGWAFCPAFP